MLKLIAQESGKLQEYGTLNMKKNIDPEGLEKGAMGVNNCLDMFSRKNIVHGFFFPCRFQSDWEEMKLTFDIRELPYKLRIDKETNRQNSIFASVSGRLTGSF